MPRYNLGQVVRCYPGTYGTATYGVVVALPWEGDPRYRVRVSTTSFREYVELGVAEADLAAEAEEAARAKEEPA